MQPVMGFIGNLGYVIVCVLGGYLTVKGMITVGNIQAFVQYLRQFNQPISQMATITNTLQSTGRCGRTCIRIFGAGRGKGNRFCFPEQVRGDVSFEHVKFGYKEDKNHYPRFLRSGQRRTARRDCQVPPVREKLPL